MADRTRAFRDWLGFALSSAALRIATRRYRNWLTGVIRYGLASAARDELFNLDPPPRDFHTTGGLAAWLAAEAAEAEARVNAEDRGEAPPAPGGPEPDEYFRNLLEQSSLGTPGARQLRERYRREAGPPSPPASRPAGEPWSPPEGSDPRLPQPPAGPR